ncbi:hypothetical protein [Noviherbaspirillum sp. UKPF54]|uniref:hypothetical protein n=1 Tax=Noviherbaspirillum sp. UKPF54 TaxID=2601898 RepID=UPI0011B17A9D|nr:hypothetical protein [Noviherbaspirillum sp. UKPF54]QDZ29559.1 hypothetical protein FAY22_17285 [Noviherbaspirillum sp. UKPF54]
MSSRRLRNTVAQFATPNLHRRRSLATVVTPDLHDRFPQHALPLFAIGQVIVTPRAAASLLQAGIAPADLLARHQHGDWGDLTATEIAANDLALRCGQQIRSAYSIGAPPTPVWVVTDRDRCTTTLLVPGEA